MLVDRTAQWGQVKPGELSAAKSPKPHSLGRQCFRIHAPQAGTEASERTDVMPECANEDVSEAGRPKPATTGVEWPCGATETENPAVALALTRLTPYVLSFP